MKIEDLANIEWLEPWTPGSFPTFVDELNREVGPGHPLFERVAIAVGRRTDCDDVLFFLLDSPAPLAVVHLTWRMRREVNATSPAVQLYSSLADWVENGMRKDHELFQ